MSNPITAIPFTAPCVFSNRPVADTGMVVDTIFQRRDRDEIINCGRNNSNTHHSYISRIDALLL